MIKYAEIYKQNIQGEIRYVAKMYVTYDRVKNIGAAKTT